MDSFTDLYKKVVKASVDNNLDAEIADLNDGTDSVEHHLDCLLSPGKQPTVMRLADCDCSDEEKTACIESCMFDAMEKDENGNIIISDENCVGCAECIKHCRLGCLTDRKEIVPIFDLLNNSPVPVYAMIAPAYISQFSTEVSPGKLRAAFKALGFAGMIEVALFADILTLKEALEFDISIQDDKDFMLTSCCCPMWIAMIRKVYNQLVPHLPPSVSPMAACGRSIKKLHPDVKTVFIGPCIAKKAESKEADIKEDVDYVLTFHEMKDIFEAAEIDPKSYDEDLRAHSSTAGRVYARTGGVSEAVQNTVIRLRPDKKIPLRARQADGVRECKAMLNDVINGDIVANFLEGMGCVGGCVGGPKILIDKESAKDYVNEYGNQAEYNTPVDNPYVIELLKRLGFDTIESLLKGNNMFTRKF
jgi:iron only hydrogenase large subunit-like protein